MADDHPHPHRGRRQLQQPRPLRRLVERALLLGLAALAVYSGSAMAQATSVELCPSLSGGETTACRRMRAARDNNLPNASNPKNQDYNNNHLHKTFTTTTVTSHADTRGFQPIVAETVASASTAEPVDALGAMELRVTEFVTAAFATARLASDYVKNVPDHVSRATVEAFTTAKTAGARFMPVLLFVAGYCACLYCNHAALTRQEQETRITYLVFATSLVFWTWFFIAIHNDESNERPMPTQFYYMIFNEAIAISAWTYMMAELLTSCYEDIGLHPGRLIRDLCRVLAPGYTCATIMAIHGVSPLWTLEAAPVAYVLVLFFAFMIGACLVEAYWLIEASRERAMVEEWIVRNIPPGQRHMLKILLVWTMTTAIVIWIAMLMFGDRLTNNLMAACAMFAYVGTMRIIVDPIWVRPLDDDLQYAAQDTLTMAAVFYVAMTVLTFSDRPCPLLSLTAAKDAPLYAGSFAATALIAIMALQSIVEDIILGRLHMRLIASLRLVAPRLRRNKVVRNCVWAFGRVLNAKSWAIGQVRDGVCQAIIRVCNGVEMVLVGIRNSLRSPAPGNSHEQQPSLALVVYNPHQYNVFHENFRTSRQGPDTTGSVDSFEITQSLKLRAACGRIKTSFGR